MTEEGKRRTSERCRGENNYSAVLTEKDVLHIRQVLLPDGLTHETIARAYGVAEVTVWRVANNLTWKHLL